MGHTLAPEAAAELDDIWYYVAVEIGSAERADRLVGISERFLLPAIRALAGRDLTYGLDCAASISATTLFSIVLRMTTAW